MDLLEDVLKEYNWKKCKWYKYILQVSWWIKNKYDHFIDLYIWKNVLWRINISWIVSYRDIYEKYYEDEEVECEECWHKYIEKNVEKYRIIKKSEDLSQEEKLSQQKKLRWMLDMFIQQIFGNFIIINKSNGNKKEI
jgi:hypothetical protein